MRNVRNCDLWVLEMALKAVNVLVSFISITLSCLLYLMFGVSGMSLFHLVHLMNIHISPNYCNFGCVSANELETLETLEMTFFFIF